ncbi:MAG: endolytic transglycosylase MltG [Prevotellaceae bacterium]|jgi:UPF0755 protein|nr:endolytic transglycosylase MltG [Prevotellaceae bacterium]
MKKKAKRILWGSILLLLLFGAAGAGTVYYYLFYPQLYPTGKVSLYIDGDDTLDSVCHKLSRIPSGNLSVFRWMARYRGYDRHIRTGHYVVSPRENVYQLFSRLYRGYQQPVNLVIGSVRTIDKLAHNLDTQLMLDSAQLAAALAPEPLSLIIPNTYQVYWNLSAAALVERLRQEHDRFWNADRRAKAAAIHLTPEEVTTLASIVEEETNDAAEKPTVAGLYLNRLRIGMPLQADPTVKYAVGNFELRRITGDMLQTDSPYNTYLHTGLPPSPIRIPTPASIDAVLNPAVHRYLYMCAKEDFSGTHNFATNLADHNRNARKYRQALNRRGIFR